MSLREYFDRLRVRAVLRRHLGKGDGEFNACALYHDTATTSETIRRLQTRRAVDALCADAAAPNRRTT